VSLLKILVPQFSLIDELFVKMNLPSISDDEYEADDIIGTSVVKFKDQFDEVLIASGDKDLMQFVDDKVKILDTMKDKIFGPQEVFEKMGVHPHQIVDYLSMLGDSSDNIPGIKGIGAKGASGLLAEYETLENVLANKETVKNKRAQKALLADGDAQAKLSKELVQIVTDIDLHHDLEELKFQFDPTAELEEFLKRLGFRTLTEKVMALKEIEARTSEDTAQETDVGEFQHIRTEPEWKNYFEHLKKEKKSFTSSFLGR
jgi:DNA polymerase-1